MVNGQTVGFPEGMPFRGVSLERVPVARMRSYGERGRKLKRGEDGGRHYIEKNHPRESSLSLSLSLSLALSRAATENDLYRSSQRELRRGRIVSALCRCNADLKVTDRPNGPTCGGEPHSFFPHSCHSFSSRAFGIRVDHRGWPPPTSPDRNN